MNDNHDRAIGRIEGKLDRLIEEHEQASKKRGELYRELENIRRRHDHTDRSISSIDKRLEQVEKPVGEFSRWRERAVGAVMFVSLAAALVGGSAVAFWQKFVALLR